jgi:hypothetical protein
MALETGATVETVVSSTIASNSSGLLAGGLAGTLVRVVEAAALVPLALVGLLLHRGQLGGPPRAGSLGCDCQRRLKHHLERMFGMGVPSLLYGRAPRLKEGVDLINPAVHTVPTHTGSSAPWTI